MIGPSWHSIRRPRCPWQRALEASETVLWEGLTSMTRMSYDETMARGAHQYRDVLCPLAAVGLDCEFIQTGGMREAIQVTLDGGYYLLLADRDDTLAWSRPEHVGWYLGPSAPKEPRQEDGAMGYVLDDDGSSKPVV